MKTCLARSMCEWLAGLLIAWAPIACHMLVAGLTDEREQAGAWAIDLILVALTTSGLTVVTLITRVAKGVVLIDRIPAHCFVVLACNLLGFLFSGVLYGEVMTHPSSAGGQLAALLLLGVTAASLYFEIVLVVARAHVDSTPANAAPKAG